MRCCGRTRRRSGSGSCRCFPRHQKNRRRSCLTAGRTTPTSNPGKRRSPGRMFFCTFCARAFSFSSLSFLRASSSRSCWFCFLRKCFSSAFSTAYADGILDIFVLQDIITGPCFQRLDGGCDFAVAGQDNDRHVSTRHPGLP